MPVNTAAVTRAIIAVAFIGLASGTAQATSITCGTGPGALPAPCTLSKLSYDGIDIEAGPSNVTVATFLGTELATTNFNSNKLLIKGSNNSATSEWIDTFTLTGGSGIATAIFNWSVGGTLTAPTGGPGAGCSAPFYNGREAGFGFYAVTGAGTQLLTEAVQASCTTNASLVISRSGSFSLDFTYGVPFLFGLELFGYADSGTADFSHTGLLTAIVLPAGSTLVTGSGTVYPAATPVPEPASLVIVGVGLVGLGVYRRRHRVR